MLRQKIDKPDDPYSDDLPQNHSLQKVYAEKMWEASQFGYRRGIRT